MVLSFVLRLIGPTRPTTTKNNNSNSNSNSNSISNSNSKQQTTNNKQKTDKQQIDNNVAPGAPRCWGHAAGPPQHHSGDHWAPCGESLYLRRLLSVVVCCHCLLFLLLFVVVCCCCFLVVCCYLLLLSVSWFWAWREFACLIVKVTGCSMALDWLGRGLFEAMWFCCRLLFGFCCLLLFVIHVPYE